MVDITDLNKTWSIIEENKYIKSDAQVIKFLLGSPAWKSCCSLL